MATNLDIQLNPALLARTDKGANPMHSNGSYFKGFSISNPIIYI
jgi:hypothetical protein